MQNIIAIFTQLYTTLQKHRIYDSNNLLSVTNTASSLLSVATGKFVTDLWNLHRSNTNLTKFVSLLVSCKHHLNKEQKENHNQFTLTINNKITCSRASSQSSIAFSV